MIKRRRAGDADHQEEALSLRCLTWDIFRGDVEMQDWFCVLMFCLPGFPRVLQEWLIIEMMRRPRVCSQLWQSVWNKPLKLRKQSALKHENQTGGLWFVKWFTVRCDLRTDGMRPLDGSVSVSILPRELNSCCSFELLFAKITRFMF